MAALSDCIITISPEQRREIAQFGIASLKKIVIIPLGFDLQPLLTCEGFRGKLRTELGVTDENLLVGIVARLTAIKNHHFFLEAASRVYQQNQAVRFVVVGDGELRAELQQRATELGIAQVVYFLGWRQDLPVVYADLDLVVLTSLNEGTPVTLIEAQAAACPVVATTVGGVPDIVQDGQTGYLVPPEDSEAFAGAVLKLLAADRLTVGQAGRQMVKAKFTVERLVRDIETLYTDLLKQKSE
jgi:glycosyltransferase involved in cell wall biosynthesis